MSSIRLRSDQIARLNASGNGARVIDFAVRRYRRGDFDEALRRRNTKTPLKQNGENVLRVYPLRRRYADIPAARLREILDLHYRIDPPEREARRREIARLDREIAALWPVGPYWIEGADS